MLKGKVGIVILNHNKNEEIESIYKQLENQTYKNFKLIVIDDNSDSTNFLDKLIYDNVSIYSYPGKFEFGLVKKYNFAFKKALENQSEYIFVLQSDMEISECPNLIERLVNHLELNQKCVVAGPIMYNGKSEITWGPKIFKKRMGHLFNVSESFLIRSNYLLRYGLWNDLFIYYGE
jgi:GT2 family glycosyltransferase